MKVYHDFVQDGTVLNANKSIKDLLEDGSEVVIECSSMKHLLHASS